MPCAPHQTLSRWQSSSETVKPLTLMFTPPSQKTEIEKQILASSDILSYDYGQVNLAPWTMEYGLRSL